MLRPDLFRRGLSGQVSHRQQFRVLQTIGNSMDKQHHILMSNFVYILVFDVRILILMTK